MWEATLGSVSSYWNFYVKWFTHQWDTMTPMKYGSVLITIAVVGYICMRNGVKR